MSLSESDVRKFCKQMQESSAGQPWRDALRFLTKISVDDQGCWIWTGAGAPYGGYGSFRFNGRPQPAHRVAYEQMVGPIPAGLQIDHLCRNRRCVNPAHLEPVSASENTRRGWVANRFRTPPTCPQGHPYDEATTYRDPKHGWRMCRVCLAAKARRRRRQKRIA